MTIDEKALRKRLASDFDFYAKKCLLIRTKDGSLTHLKLNRCQRALHERLERQIAEKGKVRAIVLKGRQVGISTYVGARFYWKLTHRRGFRAFILTHRDDASANLFDMAKRYHENCPDMLKPETGFANAKELAFPNLVSGYKVATAGGSEVGRSETIQLFHGSEVGLWPNADMHSAGIGQAIADAPNTEDIRESTAQGIGNAFHRSWKAAERGESDYEAIFIPWYWHEEYVADTPKGWKPPDAFQEYEEAYDLDRSQTYWAWLKNRKMVTEIGGSSDEISWQFRQEYPGNADEAFQTAGVGSFIRPESVLNARKFEADAYGPKVLGVDPARGGGDCTGLVDRQGRVMGSRVCKRVDISDLMALAGEVQQLVKEHQFDKVIVDTTGLGAGVYDRLREMMPDRVMGVNFAAKAFDFKHFANRRAEMWDGLREWFEDPAGVSIPDSDELHGDLCAPSTHGTIPGGTKFDSAGRLVLESKDHIRERLTFSPDLGDAAALTFAINLSESSSVDWDSIAVGGSWLSG